MIGRHAIQPGYLRNDHFDSYFASRSESLLRLIESAMGKPAVREDAREGDPTQFEEEPEDPEDDLIASEDELLRSGEEVAG